MHDNVVEIKYDSDGVLALPEGTQYSREGGEFEITSTDEILALEQGTSVYLEENSDFEAYGLVDFIEQALEVQEDTNIFDLEKTNMYNPGKSEKSGNTPVYPGGSGDTSVFDPSDYEIDDPTEYTKMMKENADTIILELFDRDITGKEVNETLDQLFTNMNDTYDRFVYEGGTEEQQIDEPQKDRGSPGKGEESKKSTAGQAGKNKLTEDEARELLSKVEESLEEGPENEGEPDDYADAEDLLTDEEQSEIDYFRSVEEQPGEGQSEISDF
jgi:hypothetical protein